MRKTKKMKKERIKRTIKIFESKIFLILIAILFMSVAYASISNITFNISGTIQAKAQNGIFISSVTAANKEGVISEEVKYYEGTTLSTSIELSSDKESTLTYTVSFFNNSESDYFFTGISYAEGAYDNEYIEFVLDKEPYSAKIAAGGPLELNLTFKYKDDVTVTSSQILNSMLNFNFGNEFIEFTLAGTKYSVPNGATWEQFINSEYNTYGFKIEDGIIYTEDDHKVYLLSEAVKVDDVITKDTTYNYKPELTLDKETLVMMLEDGKTVTNTLNATLTNISGTLNWKSSNTNVATVVGNGNSATVTAIAEGKANIIVSYGSISRICAVTVYKNGDYSLELTDSVKGTAVDYKIYGNTKQYTYGTVNLFNPTGISANTINTSTSTLDKTNSYGTTIDSTSYNGNSITVTQANYSDDVDYEGHYHNGNLHIGFDSNIIKFGKTYTFVADIKVTNNLGDKTSIGFSKSNGSNINLTNIDSGKVVITFNQTQNASYPERNILTIRPNGMSFVLSNIMLLEGEYTTSPEYVPYISAPSPNYPAQIQSVGDKTKNLLNPEIVSANNYQTYERNECTFTINGNEGSSANSYNAGQLMFPITSVEGIEEQGIQVKANTKYTLSFDYLLNKVGKYHTGIQTIIYKTGLEILTNTAHYGAVGEKKNCTVSFIPDEDTKLSLCIRINNNDVTISNIMLSEGETATEYEPYGYRIPIKVSGKNLFDKNKVQKAYIDTKNGNLLQGFYDNYFSSDYIEVPTGKDIYITRQESGNFGAFYNENKVFVCGIENNYGKIKVPSNAKYLRITVNNDYLDTMQVEINSEETNYAPYAETKLFNIYLDEPLRKIGDYADYIDFKNGKVIRNVGYTIIDGTENWGLPGGLINGYSSYRLTTFFPNYPVEAFYTNYFNTRGNVYYTNFRENVATSYSNSGQLIINVSNDIADSKSQTTTENWISWLKTKYNNGEPLSIQYQLKTPTETEISLPDLSVFDNYTKIEVLTYVQPSNMEVEICKHEEKTINYNQYNIYKHTKTETCNVCNNIISSEVVEHEFNSKGYCANCDYTCTHSEGIDYYGNCVICNINPELIHTCKSGWVAENDKYHAYYKCIDEDCENYIKDEDIDSQLHTYYGSRCTTCNHSCEHVSGYVTWEQYSPDTYYDETKYHQRIRSCETCEYVQIEEEPHRFATYSYYEHSNGYRVTDEGIYLTCVTCQYETEEMAHNFSEIIYEKVDEDDLYHSIKIKCNLHEECYIEANENNDILDDLGIFREHTYFNQEYTDGICDNCEHQCMHRDGDKDGNNCNYCGWTYIGNTDLYCSECQTFVDSDHWCTTCDNPSCIGCSCTGGSGTGGGGSGDTDETCPHEEIGADGICLNCGEYRKEWDPEFCSCRRIQ